MKLPKIKEKKKEPLIQSEGEKKTDYPKENHNY